MEKTKRAGIMLSDDHEKYLRRLGSGSLTEGVRVMIMMAQEGMLPPKPLASSDFVVPAPDPTHKKPRGALTQKELQREIAQRVMAQQIAHREAAPSHIVDIADVDPEEPPRPDPLAGWSE